MAFHFQIGLSKIGGRGSVFTLSPNLLKNATLHQKRATVRRLMSICVGPFLSNENFILMAQVTAASAGLRDEFTDLIFNFLEQTQQQSYDIQWRV